MAGPPKTPELAGFAVLDCLMSNPERHPDRLYGFTEEEYGSYRVSEDRFREFLDHPRTRVHEVALSENDYGTFLFITTSRPKETGRERVTFWGCGFHELRDRYITGEWHWYRGMAFDNLRDQEIPKDEVMEQIEQRRKEIAERSARHQQSPEGQMFEFLAEMTDDDTARADMEDLDDVL